MSRRSRRCSPQTALADETGTWRRLFTHDATAATAALLLLDDPASHAIILVGGSQLSDVESADARED